MLPRKLDGELVVNSKTGHLYQVLAVGTGAEDNEIYVMYFEPKNKAIIPLIKLISFLIKEKIWVRTIVDFRGKNSRGQDKFYSKR